jgi:Zn-dependent M16 (insulinase) family peptidase
VIIAAYSIVATTETSATATSASTATDSTSTVQQQQQQHNSNPVFTLTDDQMCEVSKAVLAYLINVYGQSELYAA